jgi:hypothetical protein
VGVVCRGLTRVLVGVCGGFVVGKVIPREAGAAEKASGPVMIG